MPKSFNAQLRLTVTEALNFQAIPDWVRQIAKVFQNSNHRVYLVGGAVRDLIWGLIPQDWDLATDAMPEEVAGLFPGSNAIGKKFGTVIVTAAEHTVEITTFRADLGYGDGRHPAAVVFCQDIVQDLARRDFTINAIAYDLITAELTDPFYGRRDCYRRVLKTVGDPRLRFKEDALRMLRFFRFLATYELRPDRRTERALEPSLIANLSMERIRDEFSKLILGKRVAIGLEGFARHGLFDRLLPELLPALRFEIGHRQLWRHLLTATETVAPVLELRLAALFHDIAKPQTFSGNAAGIHFHGHAEQGAVLCETILQRLRYPKKMINKVCALVTWHMFNLPPESGQAALRRFIVKAGAINISDLLELRRADIVATDRLDYITWEQWTALKERLLDALKEADFKNQLTINGHDLNRELKISPGPTMGKILDYLGEFILDHPECNVPETLLQAARDYLKAEAT